MFYDPSDFHFTASLEEHWQRIREEFLSIVGDLVDYAERDLYDKSWKVFGMYGFPHGEPLPDNVALCPFTASLVHQLQPNHGTVAFSVLTPGTTLKPHQGYQGDFLRCHLGLVVPAGDCQLRVGNETRKWEAGKVIVFDDRAEHEAWNRTSEPRAVLLFDFVPDPSVYSRGGNPALSRAR